MLIKFNNIEEKIITLRNEKVIIDSDVAELYGVETKRINEAVKNQAKALPPIRPTDFKSPSFAIPTTRVVSTSGAIIICTKRIKTVAKILMYELNFVAVSASKFLWTTAPNVAPSTIATKIYKVKRLFFCFSGDSIWWS